MAKQRTTRKQRAAAQSKQLTEQRQRRELGKAVEHAARPLFGTSGTGKGAHRKPTLEAPAYADTGQQYPSVMTNSPLNKQKPLRYDCAELAAREQVAQLQIAEKRKRVAVVCHKSGYQYVGEAEDPKTFGKKAQALD